MILDDILVLSTKPAAGDLLLLAAATSADNTAQPAAGSLLLTGFAGTVSAGRTIQPGAGSVLVAGREPTVTTATSRVAIDDVLVLSAVPTVGDLLLLAAATAAATSDSTSQPTAGSALFTGFAATVSAGRTLQPATAALQAVCYAPEVITGTGVILAPSLGSLQSSGYAPTVQVGPPTEITAIAYVLGGVSEVEILVAGGAVVTIVDVNGESFTSKFSLSGEAHIAAEWVSGDAEELIVPILGGAASAAIAGSASATMVDLVGNVA